MSVTQENRSQVIETTNLFRGKVVDVSRESVMVEMAGEEEKIEAFIDLMRDYGIKELARTGVIAIARGTQLRDPTAASAATPAGGKRKRSIDAPAQAALPPS